MTAIALASQAAADFDSGATAFTFSKPTGLTAGDVMIVAVQVLAGATITAPTPSTGTWTQEKLESTNANIRVAVYSRIADSADAAASTFTFTIGSASKGSIWCGRFTGVNTSTPVEAASSWTVTLTGTSGSQSVTALTAGNRLVYVAMGRHTAAGGGARTWSTSDGSDVQEHSHGTNAGTGFDQSVGVWYSNRDLTTGAQSRTVTTSSGTETAASGVMVILKPATPPTLTVRIYRAGITLAGLTVTQKVRVYRAGITIAAPQLALKVRVYRAGITIGTAAAPSGVWMCIGGNWHQVNPKTLSAGAWI